MTVYDAASFKDASLLTKASIYGSYAEGRISSMELECPYCCWWGWDNWRFEKLSVIQCPGCKEFVSK